ncbi:MULTISPECIES: hypothetical protein [unclassified Halorhabdus]|nr:MULTISPECIES: hypothetical protein [unclassified Halorhabdus]
MARTDNGDGGRDREVPVQCFESSPNRTVFTEDGNPDGWIATDLTVQPDR